MRSIHNYHQVWKQYGFLPEFYNVAQGAVASKREGYPLRPELVESAMYLYRATQDPFLLTVGEDMLKSIEHSTRTECGYATVKDVRDHALEDRMESFFLAETTKYLYLLFDPDNFIHNSGNTATVLNTPYGECIVDAGGYVFNTEAHPIGKFRTKNFYLAHSSSRQIPFLFSFDLVAIYAVNGQLIFMLQFFRPGCITVLFWSYRSGHTPICNAAPS